MTLLEILFLVLVATICGLIAQSLSGYSAGGLVAALALGFIGALLGMYLSRLLGLPEPFIVQIGEQPFPVVWSIIGGALFTAVLGLLAGRRAYG